MRKALFFALALLLLGWSVQARPTGPEQARRVAQTFLQGQGLEKAQLTDLTGQTPFEAFYTFAIEGGGFILVAADDAVEPILGYSLSNDFNPKDIPAHVMGWLEDYVDLIEASRGGAVHPSWAMLEGGVMPPEPYTAVSPLMSTTWDQSPWYNELCPMYTDNTQHCVTGCVATATAQIMKYWNHPATGYGSHSYSTNYGTLSANFGSTSYAWNSMPNYLSNGSTSAQINAVATLMYHIGVADEMDYGLSSGAHNYATFGAYDDVSSQNSLIEYFKYAPDMQAIDRERHTPATFTALLRADIDLGHPVLYSGRDPNGGHSFVLDGYDAQNRFHVNWGWGGYYDGYFYIGALNPTGGGTGSAGSNQYNLQNVALINIHPNNSWSTSGTTTVSASSVGNGTVTGSGSYNFGQVVTLSATANSGYRFSQWDGGGSFAERSFKATGGSYHFTANFESILQNDTVSYCGNGQCLSGYGYSNGSTSTWGMLIPAGLLTGRTLNAVELYVCTSGSYTVAVYEGASSPTTLIHTSNAYFSTTGWQSFALATPRAVDPSKSIWIIFSSAAAYPAALTSGCGNAQANLWGTSYSPSNLPYTFMIRAITAPASGTPDTPGTTPDGCVWNDNVGTESMAFYWAQDHTNSIYSYAEKFSNTSAITIDSISFVPYIVSGGSGNNFTVSIYDENSSGAPGTLLGGTTVYYSDLTAMTENGVELGYPVQVTGNYFVVFSLNSNPATDTLALLSTNIRTDSESTAWMQYSGNWHRVGDLFTYNGSSLHCSFFIYAHSCGQPTASGDTVTYGTDEYYTSIGMTNRAMYWGIRISPERMSSISSDLVQVRQYSVFNTTSTLLIYSGTSTGPASLIASQQVNTNIGWNNYYLQTPVAPLADGSSLWVVFYNDDVPYPAAISYASPILADGRWLSGNGTYWSECSYDGQWMIEAIFGPVRNTCTLNVASSNSAIGYTTGSGVYAMGDQVELTAVAQMGHAFASWSDGSTENPRTVTVSGDSTYTAYFTYNNCTAAQTLPYTCGMGTEELSCWFALDQDGDGNCWQSYTDYSASASHSSNTENWLVSPRIYIPAGGATLSWTVCNSSGNNFAEHYQVLMSDGGNQASDFTTQLYEETFTYSTGWVTRSVFVPDQGYIRLAFNHGDCYEHWFYIDELSVEAGQVEQHTVAVSISCAGQGSVYEHSDFQTHGDNATPICNSTVSIPQNSSYSFYCQPADGWIIDSICFDGQLGFYNDPANGLFHGEGWMSHNFGNAASGSARVTFRPTDTYDLSVLCGTGGTVYDYNEYFNNNLVSLCGTTTSHALGQSYYIEIVPEPGYRFDVAYLNGDVFLSNTDQSLGAWWAYLIRNDQTPMMLDVRFTLEDAGADTTSYQMTNISVVCAGQGEVYEFHGYDWLCGTTVTAAHNSIYQFLLEPDEGYMVDSVIFDGVLNFYNDPTNPYLNAVVIDYNVGTASTATARFTFRPEPAVSYTITANSNNPAWGTVSGGGVYEENTEVTLTATPAACHHFTQWSDGETDNPRTITLTGDLTLTALFAANLTTTEISVTATDFYIWHSTTLTLSGDYTWYGLTADGCDSTVTLHLTIIASTPEGIAEASESSILLFPNPATTSVTVEGYEGMVKVVDIQGRVVKETLISNHTSLISLDGLAKGTYFVLMGQEVRKLIVL